MKKILLGVLSGILIASLSYAGNPSVSRPATKADLVGVWDLINVRPIHDKKDPAFFPNQRYEFKQDSSMKFMVSQQAFNKEWLDKFAKQPNEINYSVSAKGLLTFTWSNKPFSESAIAAVVVQDMPKEVLDKMPAVEKDRLPKKGNLVLSFMNKSGKIAYQKVLAKIS
jgi:hypothetical protein